MFSVAPFYQLCPIMLGTVEAEDAGPCKTPCHRQYEAGRSLFWVVAGLIASRPRRCGLFLASFLRHLDLFSGGSDAEMFELFARLQGRCQPSWFQPASRPRLPGICRVTVFRGDLAAYAASSSF